LPETLAELEARAFPCGVAMRLAIQVDQSERSRLAAKVFYMKLDATRPFEAH